MPIEAFLAKVQQLDAHLSRGTPLKEALARRALPPFYIRMVEIGTRSNDLPGVLNLLADHYHRANALWTRLKGLMVYPLIVIVVALGLTLFLSLVFSHFLANFFDRFTLPSLMVASMWIPPLVLALLALVAILAFT